LLFVYVFLFLPIFIAAINLFIFISFYFYYRLFRWIHYFEDCLDYRRNLAAANKLRPIDCILS